MNLIAEKSDYSGFDLSMHLDPVKIDAMFFPATNETVELLEPTKPP